MHFNTAIPPGEHGLIRKTVGAILGLAIACAVIAVLSLATNWEYVVSIWIFICSMLLLMAAMLLVRLDFNNFYNSKKTPFGISINSMKNAIEEATGKEIKKHFWILLQAFIFVSVASLLFLMLLLWFFDRLALFFEPIFGTYAMWMTDILAPLLIALSFFAALYAGRSVLRASKFFRSPAEGEASPLANYKYLYLRGFNLDKKRVYDYGHPSTMMEPLIVSRLNHFAKTIAIGAPDDVLPPVGADRRYFSNSTWQEAVEECIGHAEAIVFQVGKGSWLPWEFSRVIESGKLRYCLIIFPSHLEGPVVESWNRMVGEVKDPELAQCLSSIDPRKIIMAFFSGSNVGFAVRSDRRDVKAYIFGLWLFLYCRYVQSVPESGSEATSGA